jgi:channel protein (hemolysin III family)
MVGGLRWLVARRKAYRPALGVFIVAAALLLVCSGGYHMLELGADRRLMQRLDHAAIFTMIAGTFTAIHGVAFRGRWRGTFLLIVWALALTGLALKTIFFDDIPESVGLVLYLGLGGVGGLSAWGLWRSFGWAGARALIWGGAVYSTGAAYDFFRGPALIDGVIGAHEVFHLSVVIGMLLHWNSVRTLISLRDQAFDAVARRVSPKGMLPTLPGADECSP